MCNKLSVFCLMLAVVVALSVPASASSTITLATPLKVDISGRYGNTTRCDNYFDWPIAVGNGNWDSPQNGYFDMGSPLPWENPATELDVYRKTDADGGGAINGGSRNRSGGFAYVGETGEYYLGGKGYGTNYIKLVISNLDPDTTYKIYLWSYEERSIWAGNKETNPDMKWGCWSTTNPKKWLDENGYSGNNGEPNGYGPIVCESIPPPQTDSNMPQGLKDLVLACGAEGGRLFLMTDPCLVDQGDKYLSPGSEHQVSFYFHTAPGDIASGQVTVYGWIDPTDWGGSAHMPLNGFMVIPEPMTVALLGLGGLALLRRKRA